MYIESYREKMIINISKFYSNKYYLANLGYFVFNH